MRARLPATLALPLLALLVGLGFAAMVTQLAHRSETDRARYLSERRLNDIGFEIERMIDRVNVVLQVSRSFMESRQGGAISRARFSRFHSQLSEAGFLDGIQGLGFSALITQADIAGAEARIRTEYAQTRSLWPPPVPGRLRSAITLLEPADARNLAALGFDMLSEDRRRAAMEGSMLSGAARMSAPVTLVQEITDDRQIGVLIYLYTRSEMNDELPGFLFAPLRLGRLFSVLLEGRHPGFALRVYDTEDPQQVLFQSPDAPPAGVRLPDAQQTITVSGRDWALELYDLRGRGLISRLPMTLLVGLLSVLSVLLGVAALRSLQVSLHKAAALSEAQSRILAQKDLHLREMSHRLKNVLARVSAIARQTAHHESDPAAFLSSFNSRLQAMAAAQDLLTRAAPAGTSLTALLRAELMQIYGDEPASVSLSGPDLPLTPAQTEALGLVFHELATNALKYGPGTRADGRIAISWKQEGDQLRLEWRESGARHLTAPAAPGFGTRLMRSCIEGNLGGSVSMEYLTCGLLVKISVPYQGVKPN